MAEHGTTPVPVRGLRLLKGDTAAGDTAPGTEGDTQGDTMGDTAPIPVSAPDAVAVPLSLPERVRLAVAHWAGTAAGWAGSCGSARTGLSTPCGTAGPRQWPSTAPT